MSVIRPRRSTKRNSPPGKNIWAQTFSIVWKYLEGNRQKSVESFNGVFQFPCRDLFNVIYGSKIVQNFKEGKLDCNGNPLEPSPMEQLSPEEVCERYLSTKHQITLVQCRMSNIVHFQNFKIHFPGAETVTADWFRCIQRWKRTFQNMESWLENWKNKQLDLSCALDDMLTFTEKGEDEYKGSSRLKTWKLLNNCFRQ